MLEYSFNISTTICRMSTCEGPGPDATDDLEEHSSYEEYSDDEPYCSEHHEYEVPVCFCGKEAKQRISGTDKSWMGPSFNCPKRNFSRVGLNLPI